MPVKAFVKLLFLAIVQRVNYIHFYPAEYVKVLAFQTSWLIPRFELRVNFDH